MSKEQEDAAKWQMFESYKEHAARLATISGKIQAWATTMYQLGNQLQNNAWALPNVNQFLIDQLPDKTDLKKASQEINELRGVLTTLTSNLSKAGMDVSKM